MFLETQCRPFLSFHETLIHPAIEILLSCAATGSRLTGIRLQACHISCHKLFAFTFMVERKGTSIGRTGLEIRKIGRTTKGHAVIVTGYGVA